VNPKQGKLTTDPQRIFKAAEVFLEASILLHDNVVLTQLRMAVPWGVTGAFALELYLKCLLTIECGMYPEDHDLKELFRNLPRQTRDALRKKHDDLAEKDTHFAVAREKIGIQTNLDSLLETGKDAFTQLRYAFKEDPIGTWGLNIFTWCVRERILSLRPDWRRIFGNPYQRG
jgi:hypothetical protein